MNQKLIEAIAEEKSHDSIMSSDKDKEHWSEGYTAALVDLCSVMHLLHMVDMHYSMLKPEERG